ncbi:uncharacterized protein LOC123273301 [Cotesia glomerata]|uniref:Uncharacterized protein n=1 Tax=Cotesia glomerata TaxID=32391 RepID=A0AAV7J0S4_COTGL|nr:uncharacterized protein LOC123273301 [Cotesia glomerata]KAH0564313.1 hypothetical protein KQX54_011383 [Cotesia glomerata]
MNLKRQIGVFVCALLVITITPVSGEINPEALIKVVEFGWKAIKAILKIESFIKDNKFQDDVIDALGEIRESTARIEYLITDEADRIIRELSLKIDMQIVHKFVETVDQINERFENKFLKYFSGSETYEPETIESYINATIDESKFRKILSKIREFAVPRNFKPGLFEILHNYLELKASHVRDCDEGESASDQIFSVFNLAMTGVMKGYSMVTHAYKYLQLHSASPNTTYKCEMRDALEEFQTTVHQVARAARIITEIESRSIRRCDPEKFEEGENYESYQFLTTFVTNDYILSNRKYIIDGLYTNQRTAAFCDGDIYDKIYEAWSLGACLAPVNSKRRYNYVSVLGGDFYYYNKGRETEDCEIDYGLNHSKWQWHYYFYRYICEEPDYSRKAAYFNTTAQYSDFNNNRVITGIRLVTKLSITYFEIQQGVLVNGTIDNTTVEWDDRVTRHLDYYEINHLFPSYTNGDLVRLTYNLRSLNLDDVDLPAGMVAVGVQFKLVKNRLTFQVAGMRVVDESGQFVSSSTVEWFSKNNSNRTELKIGDLDIPTFSNKPNLELSKQGKEFVKFQMSSWNIDGSQTLYPFIDLQNVITHPPAPIGGIGLFYKGQQGFGGFIAPKLISLNTTILMSDEYLNNIFNDTATIDFFERLGDCLNQNFIEYNVIFT